MKKEFCKNIDYFLRYFTIRKQIFPTFLYSSIIIFEKMDTMIIVYIDFFSFFKGTFQNFIKWVKYIIGRSEDTSLKEKHDISNFGSPF